MMTAFSSVGSNDCIRVVASFEELVATPFSRGVNAVCWPRVLGGDFAEVAAQLGMGEGIETLNEERLTGLALSGAGRLAVTEMLTDWQRLRARGLDPQLNAIHGYARDEEPGPISTDVFSFHADSAPTEAETWLCTYHGLASEGLRNEDGRRRVDVPETRAALLQIFDGEDGVEFLQWLNERCFDLHYAPLPGAQPFSFGLGNLWRIAVEWPGSPVPPCIHRAPETFPGQPARLLLIS